MIKRLEIERRRRGLSQVRLAGILGVHWTNVSELERGILTPLPGSPLVRKLERFFLPLRLDDLLADIDPERHIVGGRS